jgi:hypothetical protein
MLSLGLSKDGLCYVDKPTDRRWTALGSKDCGGYTSPSGGVCITSNSRAFEESKSKRRPHDQELRLHAYIEISIKLPETARSDMRVMARVTRNLKDGVGVEWCEFAPSAVSFFSQSSSAQGVLLSSQLANNPNSSSRSPRELQFASIRITSFTEEFHMSESTTAMTSSASVYTTRVFWEHATSSTAAC